LFPGPVPIKNRIYDLREIQYAEPLIAMRQIQSV
jgi:hypothetical protein